ncbi:MAG: SDR family NAD(P)-dependent oxidoreductase [Gemmobacter sp.]|nr:SDR family NAD(P)-dependent oxidoreductase [Gemmobacter sp.]
MKRALVIGASGGVGGAVAAELEARGLEVTRISRRIDGLDVTDDMSVARVLGALAGPFDLVFVATGILAPRDGHPEKSLDQIDATAFAEVLAVNTIGTALVLRQVPRLLAREGCPVVAVLTARVGSIGDNALGGWYAYRASKAAANQIVRTAAIEIGRKHKSAVVVALHPGTVATAFTDHYPGHKKVSPKDAAKNLIRVVDGLKPGDNGRFLDWAGAEVPW